MTTQQQIAMATEELMRQNDAAQSTRHLTEDDKQGMRRTLTAKIDKVPLLITIYVVAISELVNPRVSYQNLSVDRCAAAAGA